MLKISCSHNYWIQPKILADNDLDVKVITYNEFNDKSFTSLKFET